MRSGARVTPTVTPVVSCAGASPRHPIHLSKNSARPPAPRKGENRRAGGVPGPRAAYGVGGARLGAGPSWVAVREAPPLPRSLTGVRTV